MNTSEGLINNLTNHDNNNNNKGNEDNNDNNNNSSSRLENHPMRGDANWMTNMLAISLHGDGVPVLRVGKACSQTYETYSMQSIFASGPTLEIKIFLVGIFGATIAEDTMLEIWRVLCWSFFSYTKESGQMLTGMVEHGRTQIQRSALLEEQISRVDTVP